MLATILEEHDTREHAAASIALVRGESSGKARFRLASATRADPPPPVVARSRPHSDLSAPASSPNSILPELPESVRISVFGSKESLSR